MRVPPWKKCKSSCNENTLTHIYWILFMCRKVWYSYGLMVVRIGKWGGSGVSIQPSTFVDQVMKSIVFSYNLKLLFLLWFHNITQEVLWENSSDMTKEYGGNINIMSGANMKQSPFERLTAHQKCPRILWTPNVNYHSWIDGRTRDTSHTATQ